LENLKDVEHNPNYTFIKGDIVETDFINQLFEVFQAWSWDDDGVATSAYVFSDAEETPTWIFLQGELEGLALDLNFFRAQGIFVHRGFG